MKALLSLVFCLFLWCLAGAQVEVANTLKNNVVAITATFENGQKKRGFGFITGESNGELYIVTANHNLTDRAKIRSIDVLFHQQLSSQAQNATVEINNDIDDVALIRTTKPNNWSWRKDCLGIPVMNQRVVFIGRKGGWFVPVVEVQQGAISEIAANELTVDIVSVQPGTSGAPLINADGIVGLIIEDEGRQAIAVEIERVKEIVTENGRAGFTFQLTGAGIDFYDTNDSEIQQLQAQFNDWVAIKESENIEDFRAFVQKYPNSDFRKLAMDKIRELEAEKQQQRERTLWKITQELDNADAYRRFLKEFPDSPYRSLAEQRLQELSRPEFEGMVLVEGGRFQMGCTDEQKDCSDDEKPVHEVRIPDFYLGQFEVTVQEYLDFARQTNSRFPEWLEEGSSYHIRTGTDDYYKKLGDALTHLKAPITGVSWYDAVAFCNWKSQQDDLTPYYKINGRQVTFQTNANGYRLPSEAEWEFAARGGNQSQEYPYAGSHQPDLVAWNKDNSNLKMHPVGQLAPNELNLYDMSGNVWEWTNDCWNEDYNGGPANGQPWLSGDCDRRVLRGGSWNYYTRGCRVADRVRSDASNRISNYGFRLARAR